MTQRGCPSPLFRRANAARAWVCVLGVWLSTGAGAEVKSSSWQVAMANPAAVACAQAGGISKKTMGDKGEQSWCQLPSGQLCDEWAFFKGHCGAPGAAASTDVAPSPASASPQGTASPPSDSGSPPKP